MRLSDISPSKGTYVGLRVLQPANDRLYQHCLDNGIEVKKSMFDRRLHVTVLYSRKHCPNIRPDRDITHYNARFSSYDVFTGQNGKYALVMKLSAPGVTARHLKLMAEHGATYDYPEYLPHITLSYDYDMPRAVGIAPFPHNIILSEEYVEDLNLDWSA
jgi:hypothetical protein